MKLIKFVVTCLLGISFFACQDKTRQEEDLTPSPDRETLVEKDFTPLFEAEMSIIEDQSKSVDITMDRKVDPSDRSKLYSPRIKFEQYKSGKPGELRPLDADLLFVREKVGKDTEYIREKGKATFISLSSDGRKGKVRVSIKKDNPKATNSLFTLEADETWYAMVILQSDTLSLVDEQGRPAAVFGETIADRRALSSRPSLREIVKFAGDNQTGGTGGKIDFRLAIDAENTGYHDIPLISNWMKLEIIRDASNHDHPSVPVKTAISPLFRLAKNTSFKIQPQGLLLNYQVIANVYEGLQMRRAGVVSNALDFQGVYLLGKNNIKEAFENRNTGTGFGIPEWEGTKSKLNEVQGLMLYKPSAQDYDLGYPWDMPMVSDDIVSTLPDNTGTPMETTMGEADMAMALFLGRKPGSEYPGYVVGTPVGLTTPRIKAANDAPGNYSDVYGHVQWAMPKKVAPSKPFTYFWIDAGSAHSAEEYFQSNSEWLYVRDGSQYLRFLQKKSPRTQPMVVVHQTKSTFENQVGKAPRLYSPLSADLLITELTYKMCNGKNYSVVEIQNPSRLNIDLNDYALVRLVSNGSYMQYRRSDGQGTDNLDEAELLRLSTLSKSSMVSGYGPNDNQYAIGAEDTDLKKRTYEWNYTKPFRRYYHQFETSVNGKTQRLLDAGQIVLIGAGAYASNSPTSASWWNEFFPTQQQTEWYTVSHRFRYFAIDPSAVLNLNSENRATKDGIALVKLFPGGKKKIIDATAPIGRNNYAFAGTYESYSDEFRSPTKTKNKAGGVSPDLSTYYTQKRMDGVVFPFIPPYRTVRVKNSTVWSDDWELLVEPNSHKLGHRWLASMDAANITSGGFVSLDRYSYFTARRTPLVEPGKSLYLNSRPEHR